MDVFEKLDVALRSGKRLTNDFLHEQDETGWSVAHILATRGLLPEWFVDFSLADETGWTVAHVLATVNKLPPGFFSYHLANNDGDTIAHVLAENQRIDQLDKVSKRIKSIKNLKGISADDILKEKTRERIEQLKSILKS